MPSHTDPPPAAPSAPISPREARAPVDPAEPSAPATSAEPGEPQPETVAMAEMSRRMVELQQENRRQAAELEQLNKDARHKRFTDEILGCSDGGQIRWVGPVEQHVAMLETLADATGGEESEQVRAYVELQRSHAEQLRAAGLFSERGSSARGAGSVAGQIDELVARALSEQRARSREQAYDLVLQEHPQLYDALAAEQPGGAR